MAMFAISVGAQEQEKPGESRGQILFSVTPDVCDVDCTVRIEAAVAPHVDNYLLVLVWYNKSGAGSERFFRLNDAPPSTVHYAPFLQKGEYKVRALVYRRPDIEEPYDEVEMTVKVVPKPTTTNVIRFGREP